MTIAEQAADWVTKTANKGPAEVAQMLGASLGPRWQDAISLAIIVHPDEHEALARCLKAAAPWVGQIVVVDTGPTPSPKIAVVVALHGGQVVHHPWGEDFAAARNAALPHLTGAWVMTLDADEVLEVQHAEGLKAAVGADHADVFGLVLLDRLDAGEMAQPLHRLFRREAPGLTYRSRVHEFVEGTRDGRMRVGGTTPAVLIHHDGHTAKAASALGKGERNLRLAQLELAERPDDPYAWYLVAAAQGPAGLAQAQPLWQRFHAWAKANPMAVQYHGWARHALVASVAHTAGAAQAFEAAGLAEPAHQTWARTAWLAASARALLPGLGEELAQLGGPDLRFWSALARFKLGDPAGALDELRPVMGGELKSWFTVEAAWLERYKLWARLQLAVGHASEAVGFARELAAQVLPGMPRQAWADEVMALLDECESAAVAQAEQAQAFLRELGQEEMHA